MQVFKRGSVWVYRFEIAKVGGKRQREQKSGFKTKKEAELAGITAYKQYSTSGAVFSPSEISVSDYYDLWIEEYCLINCKYTTIEGYKKRIKNYIKPSIGKFRLSSITSSAIQGLLNDLFNKGLARNSLISIKALLTGAFDYAVHPLGFISHNPASVVRLPSPRATPAVPTRKKIKVPVTEEQFETIMKRFPEGHPYHIPLQIANKTGLREGECFALTWKDVDLENKFIVVDKQVQNIEKKWTFVPPKYDSDRKIYIDEELTELLKRTKQKQEACQEEYAQHYTPLYSNDKDQITNEKTGERIFLINVRDDGTYIQPRTMAHLGRVVHYNLGFKSFDFHSLRHTHATALDTNGASMVDIKERLGHFSLKTTQKYIHDNDALRDRTKKIIEAIYKKKHEL
jgi:integrase